MKTGMWKGPKESGKRCWNWTLIKKRLMPKKRRNCWKVWRDNRYGRGAVITGKDRRGDPQTPSRSPQKGPSLQVARHEHRHHFDSGLCDHRGDDPLFL